MGIEPYLIASTLEGIIAQRLARRVCPHCNEMHTAEPERIQDLLGSQTGVITSDLLIPRAVGCKECRNRGYRGRIGLFEVILMSEELREMTIQSASASQLKRAAMRLGMKNAARGRLEKSGGWLHNH